MADNWHNDLLSTELRSPDPGRMPPTPSVRWRRMTDQEVLHEVRKEERRWRLHPLPPLLVGAGAAVLLQCARMPDVRSGWQGISPRQAVLEFPVVFLVCFVGAYLLQLGINPLRYRTPVRVTICIRCHDISTYNGNDKCQCCGGELDDADRWTHEPGSE